jgi:hypothetical protein
MRYFNFILCTLVSLLILLSGPVVAIVCMVGGLHPGFAVAYVFMAYPVAVYMAYMGERLSARI